MYNAAHPSRRFRPTLLLVFLALLPGSVAGDAGLSPGSGTKGVQVTREVPFASETFDAVRTAAPGRPTPARENRAIPSHRINRNPLASSSGMPQATLEAPAIPFSVPAAASIAPSAPVLDNRFAGLENPPHGQTDVIPPDTMGAAGPSHLVSLLNSDFGVFDKNGGRLDKVTLQSFWASLGTGSGQPADFPFDPKILYDQHSGRFIAVTLGGGIDSAPDSWVMVAVSSTTNPLDNWYKWAIDADVNDGRIQTDNWVDYPGFGIDENNIYITGNMFQNFGAYVYSKIWVIPKAQLLSGTNPIKWTEFSNLPDCPSMQPAHTFGIASAEYFIYEGGANQLLLARIDNTSGIPVWHTPAGVDVDPYVASAGFPEGAPQAGESRTIHTSDTRLLNAVFRNGFVWTTHTVSVNGKTEIAWYRINPGTGKVAAQGRISDALRWYYYPSIAVNQDNVAAIGFSGSSTLEYVGGYYTILQSPYVSAEPVSLLKSGAAPYYKILTGTDNRWGDFSATVVDPTDNVTFWTLQEYAQTPDPVTLKSRWGTWWGKFRPSVVSAPSVLTATASTLPQVVLYWTADSSNQTGFTVERRRLPGQDYSPIPNATLGPNVTTFTDNASTGLLGGFTYSYRVQAFNGSGGSYSGEAFASTVAPPPPPTSGGGGGGCLAIAPSIDSTADASSILSLAILFLPAAVYGWKRHRPC